MPTVFLTPLGPTVTFAPRGPKESEAPDLLKLSETPGNSFLRRKKRKAMWLLLRKVCERTTVRYYFSEKSDNETD